MEKPYMEPRDMNQPSTQSQEQPSGASAVPHWRRRVIIENGKEIAVLFPSTEGEQEEGEE